MYIQVPHLTALELANHTSLGVYSSIVAAGSPIDRELNDHNLFITEIDERPIFTLDDVVSVVRDLKSTDVDSFNSDVASGKRLRGGKMPGRFVKVTLVTLTGETKIVSLHTNDMYHPAWQIRRGPLVSDAWVWEKL
ncbi:hypothetical protein GGI21_005166 [Coemansia aciculifera]|nr:hypothetical protein GGI21_005166 [Coemansia aciculifera]